MPDDRHLAGALVGVDDHHLLGRDLLGLGRLAVRERVLLDRLRPELRRAQRDALLVLREDLVDLGEDLGTADVVADVDFAADEALSVQDETSAFGDNASLFDTQSKEERDAKTNRNYVGNGSVIWTDGNIVAAERKQEAQPAQEPAVEEADFPF